MQGSLIQQFYSTNFENIVSRNYFLRPQALPRFGGGGGVGGSVGRILQPQVTWS